MATTLQSPGVQVSIINESFYTPAAPGTVPLIFVASADNKTNPSGTTAPGTKPANAGKVYLITSQRDLTDTFGTPLFYTDANSNPIHGGELNEYGLQAAYSLLGVSSAAYVVRANLDLASLVAKSDAPAGAPTDGSYWVDTAKTVYGIFEWDNTAGTFTNKTPLVIDDSNSALNYDVSAPKASFGKVGEYAVVLNQPAEEVHVFYKKTSGTWTEVGSSDWITAVGVGAELFVGPHTQYPDFTGATTGSVYVKTTSPNAGANWYVKQYSASANTFNKVPSPIYGNVTAATYNLDKTGGGANIPVGTLFVESNYDHGDGSTSTSLIISNFRVQKRVAVAPTKITSTVNSSTVSTSTLYVKVTVPGTLTPTGETSISVTGGLDALVAALNSANIDNLTATMNANGSASITHTTGGDILFRDASDVLGDLGFNTTGTNATADYYVGGENETVTSYASNWMPVEFTASTTAPSSTPANGQLWYSSIVDQVDILVHDGSKWTGYANAFPDSDPNGPIVSATQPTLQSDGVTALANGDVWISTADLERYGKDIYVYNGSSLQWVLQDTTDQTSPTGWLFDDARWATDGTATEESTIAALRDSNYVDPDAPDPALYPRGMRLWNLRRSGFNVKKYVRDYINPLANNGENIRVPGDMLDTYNLDRWVSVSPNAADGSGSFGRHAQRSFVVESFKALVDGNQAIRDTDTLNFNLIACPGYTEAIANLVSFNIDRGLTAFVVGDTPFRLKPTGTELKAYGLNSNGSFDNDDNGAVTYNEYMAQFYPSGYTNDLAGNYIVVPPSHMMLRTIAVSDQKSYPWFAPAGIRRGVVDNATSVGYLQDGEFKAAALPTSLRDVMASVKINPIATLTGAGIVNFGQYTRANAASALDRINVARLVCYLRRQLDILAKPFLFEPNDKITRNEIKNAVQSLLLELVGQRALYDFIVVCDESNNTAARIDRSELWVDVAIEPVKAVEFIYIPVRLVNTGAIKAGTYTLA